MTYHDYDSVDELCYELNWAFRTCARKGMNADRNDIASLAKWQQIRYMQLVI